MRENPHVHPEPVEGLFSYSALSFWPLPHSSLLHLGQRVTQDSGPTRKAREGEKNRSCRLKSPACELGWEKDLGEVLFTGIAPGLKSRPPKDEEKDRRVDGEEVVVTSSGVGHYALPRSLRPGAARGTRKACFMADVRAARTGEKVGHSGRDDGEEQEGPGPSAGLRAGKAGPYI
jgi:hypothetical protein